MTEMKLHEAVECNIAILATMGGISTKISLLHLLNMYLRLLTIKFHIFRFASTLSHGFLLCF